MDPAVSANHSENKIRTGKRGLHPLLSTRLSSWLTLLRRYGRHIPLSQWPRMSLISLSSAIGTPIRCYESLRLRREIRDVELQPPVFIIGHWRSGTTNFHNHMLQDSQFGYVSLLHCLAPPTFFSMEKPVRRLLKSRLPATRPMDAVPVGLDEPMSEDFAMACLSEFTHYHRYFFPESNDEVFARTILFDGVSDSEIDAWHQTYDRLLRKVTIAAGGRRLILKNPPHTGRVRQLMKYYPDAKFIHVYRNPFEVFASTQKLMQKFLNLFSFQRFDHEQVQLNVLRDYAKIMKRFLDDEHLLPQDNYIAVRHEDVIADGVGTLQRVYEQLQLPGFEELRPRLQLYVDSISDYQTNTYEFTDALTARIREHCGFAIDRWGYLPPSC
jgi:hypothetical protein